MKKLISAFSENEDNSEHQAMLGQDDFGQIQYNENIVKTPEDKIWYALRTEESSNIGLVILTGLTLDEVDQALEHLQENNKISTRCVCKSDKDNDYEVTIWKNNDELPPNLMVLEA